jgi:hypothetical protein
LFCNNVTGLKNAGCGGPVSSKEAKYPVSAIPAELNDNADAVIREFEIDVEVRSLNSLVIKVHRVVTVLRESGLKNAGLEEYYDQDSKISAIKIVYYNDEGVETKHIRHSNIIDESAIPDGLFYVDKRVKKVKMISAFYPFTIEYSYEKEFHGLLSYPAWEPQNDYRLSLEHAQLVVSADDELLPRFNEINIPRPATIAHDKNRSSVTYTFQDLPAIESEPFSIPLAERVPLINIAPNIYRTLKEDFDFRSWKSIGLWDYSINKDHDILPAKTRQELLDRIKEEKDYLSKIRAIYRFVQETTRYVCISMGIGGMQTVEAGLVAEKGYGDCKGLVNYTKALLSAAGITSYATLVNAGENEPDILPGFPSDQFDHVILCVPRGSDTIWLECTNQSMPFGFLGSFTDDRHVLIITPDGGVLARTPVYPGTMNCLSRKVTIDLDTNGNAAAGVFSTYRGLRYEEVAWLEHRSVKEMEDEFIGKIKVPSASIKSISYSFKKDQAPEARETVNLTIRSYATRAGNRIFLPFNLFSNVSISLNQLSSRKSPLYFRSAETDSVTIEIHIPPGYKVESLPETTELTSQFGHYKVTAMQKNNTLTYCRVLEKKEGRYPPGSFAEFTSYLQKIAHSDKNNAILIKN